MAPEEFFTKCMSACRWYEQDVRRAYCEFKPMGWLVITEQQRNWLLQGIPNYMNPQELLRRSGAVGYFAGMPIHIAKPDDKIENWLYGRFVVDMRKEEL